MRHSKNTNRADTELATRVEWHPENLERLIVRRGIRRSFSEVEEELRMRPEELLRLAYGLDEATSVTTISLALHPSLPWLRIEVQVESFTPPTSQHGVAVIVTWRALHHAWLFPVMKANLSARPAVPNGCELVLDGEYRPPLGLLGLVFDRIVGRWVALGTARSFIERVATRIDAPRAPRTADT